MDEFIFCFLFAILHVQLILYLVGVVGPNQYVSNFELVQINSVKFSWSISTGSVTVVWISSVPLNLIDFVVGSNQ